MLVYCTSKNTGPSWQSDPITIVYLGPVLRDAIEAVGDFQKYSREELPITEFKNGKSALPRMIDFEFVNYYMADGWWYTIVSFEIPSEVILGATPCGSLVCPRLGGF